VLSGLVLVSFATGAELRFHIDFSTSQARTASGKPVLIDRSGGLQAEIHNIGWTDTPFGKAALFNGRTAVEGGSYVVVPGSTEVPLLVDFQNGPFTIGGVVPTGPRQGPPPAAGAGQHRCDTGPGYRLTYSWRALRFMSGTGGHKAEGKPDYWAVVTNPATHKVVEGGWNHVAVVRDDGGFRYRRFFGLRSLLAVSSVA